MAQPAAAPATAWPLPTIWPPTAPTAAPLRQEGLAIAGATEMGLDCLRRLLLGLPVEEPVDFEQRG